MTVNNKSLGIQDGSIQSTTELEASSSGLFWFPQKDGSRVYYVLSKNISQTDIDIIATPGIPAIGTLIDGAPVRRYKAKEINRVRHPTGGTPAILWTVTVETDSRFDAANQSASDPTDIRPKRRWYTEKEDERVEIDINNIIIETPALEPLNVERPFINLVLEIERYENYPTNPSAIFSYVQHTNEAAFYGCEIGACLLDDIQSDEEVIDGTTYIKVRYVFKFKIRWDQEASAFIENTVRVENFLAQGYMYRKTASAEPETYLDKHGHPVKVNLAADGTLLPDGDPPTKLDYDMVPYADFSALNLEF